MYKSQIPVVEQALDTAALIVAATKEPGPTYVWRLHALSLATGAEKFGGPVAISATNFSAQSQMNRSALLLSEGVVYVAFGSYQDVGAWHGWLFAYDSQTLQRLAVLNTTPTGGGGALWNSGSGPAADSAGNIFIATGNGSFNASSGGSNIGDSMVKLALVNNNKLAILDYTPFDQDSLDQNDFDFGAGGVILLPDQATSPTHLALNGSKDKNLYVINRDNMGHVHTSDNGQAVQVLSVGDVRSAPAYWNGTVYLGAISSPVRAYSISQSKITGIPHPRRMLWGTQCNPNRLSQWDI